MKISKDLKRITTTQSAFGKVIGKTAGRVNQLVQEGIVILDENTDSGGVLLVESLKNYYILQRGNVPNNSVGDGGKVGVMIDYNYEHARLEKLKADREEIRVNKLKGELYEAKQVEYTITGMYTVLRNQLQGLPSLVCSELAEEVRSDAFRIMTEKIDNYLAELSAIDTSEFIGGDNDGEV